MRRVIMAGLRAHKRRLFGTVTSIVLGVAFLTATLVLTESARSGFGDLFREAYAGTAVAVRSDTRLGAEQAMQVGYLPTALAEQIEALDGVAAAEPYFEGFAQLEDADGDPLGGSGPPTIGASWITEPGLNPYRLVAGRAPTAAGEVVIDQTSAERGGLALGDRTTVRTPAPVEVTVVGIAGFGGGDSLGGTTFTAFTFAEAERLLAPRPGVASQIVVAAAPGVSPDGLAERVRAVAPANSEVLTGAELAEQSTADLEADFLGFFQTIMLVFAGIALFVALFTIYNTFAIIAAARRRESALLRAIGARRGQVLLANAIEAALVGCFASLLGLGAGVGLSFGLVALLDQFGMGLAGVGLTVGVGSAVLALGVGTVVATVAALVPAWRSSRVPPVAALGDAAVEDPSVPRVRSVIGLLLAAAGIAVVVAGALRDDAPPVPMLAGGAIATLLGVIIAAPALVRPAVRALGAPVARVRGVSGRLARTNALRNPRRTAATATALIVGVAVVSMVTVLTSAIKDVWGGSQERAIVADLIAATNGFSGVGISPQLRADLEAVDGVTAAVGLLPGTVQLGDESQGVRITSPGDLPAVLDLDVRSGSWDAVTGRALGVSSGFAEDHGLAVGESLELGFADGARESFTVRAVYDRTDLVGDVVLPAEAWEPHSNQQMYLNLLVALDGSASVSGSGSGSGSADGSAVRDRLDAVVDAAHGPELLTEAEYLDTLRASIDQVLGLVYALLALSLLIALLGIGTTLGLAVHERTRELGLLRAVGQTRRQTRSMVRWESVLIAVLGACVGALLGAFLGWGVASAVFAAEPVTVGLPLGSLAILLVVGAVAGVLAAVRPARRAARLDILTAIRTD